MHHIPDALTQEQRSHHRRQARQHRQESTEYNKPSGSSPPHPCPNSPHTHSPPNSAADFLPPASTSLSPSLWSDEKRRRARTSASPHTCRCSRQALGLQGRRCPFSPDQLLEQAAGDGWLLLIRKAASPPELGDNMHHGSFWGHVPHAFIFKTYINRHAYSFLKGHGHKKKIKAAQIPSNLSA